jgi:hypothetical protein
MRHGTRVTAFSCTVLTEAAGIRAAVEKSLSETVFIHHTDPEIARKKLARLGLAEVSPRYSPPVLTREGGRS